MAIPVINDRPDYKFELGRGIQMADGKDVTVIATGMMVEVALRARDLLANEGISARVINIHTIKPLDEEIVLRAAAETGAIVTAEEATVIGGLGGAVSELLSEKRPTPVVKLGINDVFGKSGPAKELVSLFGLTAENIAAKAKAAIALK